ICGSDLHYYNHGGFGTVRLKEPMILGHEVSGHVESLGEGVTGLTPGQLVAISPSRPCGECKYSKAGLHNHCLNMRFYGSAMPFPHIQGAFREYLVADAEQCVPADNLSPEEAALAEPLAVVLHAAKQAGDLAGKRVLVTGCGPIGLLAVAVARMAGAVEIHATDLAEFPLTKAKELGADVVHNVGQGGEALAALSADKGYFDAAFECSGAEIALRTAIDVLAARGKLVQLGLGGDMTVPMQALTAKEISLVGSFRFHEEFATAIQLMQAGRLKLKSLVTQTLTLDDAEAAFQLAGDREQAIKVQLTFGS
ncbi:MAG: L-idonate 5-dehydrogenase, partial [Pseudomonadota bacterium]